MMALLASAALLPCRDIAALTSATVPADVMAQGIAAD